MILIGLQKNTSSAIFVSSKNKQMDFGAVVSKYRQTVSSFKILALSLPYPKRIGLRLLFGSCQLTDLQYFQLSTGIVHFHFSENTPNTKE